MASMIRERPPTRTALWRVSTTRRSSVDPTAGHRTRTYVGASSPPRPIRAALWKPPSTPGHLAVR